MAVLQPPSSSTAPAKKQSLPSRARRENRAPKKKEEEEEEEEKKKKKKKKKNKDKEVVTITTATDGQPEDSQSNQGQGKDKASKKRKVPSSPMTKSPSDLDKVNANIYRKKYKRGKEVELGKISDKKLKAQVKQPPLPPPPQTYI